MENKMHCSIVFSVSSTFSFPWATSTHDKLSPWKRDQCQQATFCNLSNWKVLTIDASFIHMFQTGKRPMLISVCCSYQLFCQCRKLTRWKSIGRTSLVCIEDYFWYFPLLSCLIDTLQNRQNVLPLTFLRSRKIIAEIKRCSAFDVERTSREKFTLSSLISSHGDKRYANRTRNDQFGHSNRFLATEFNTMTNLRSKIGLIKTKTKIFLFRQMFSRSEYNKKSISRERIFLSISFCGRWKSSVLLRMCRFSANTDLIISVDALILCLSVDQWHWCRAHIALNIVFRTTQIRNCFSICFIEY